jgi:superfamily II DNA or RNA helicase
MTAPQVELRDYRAEGVRRVRQAKGRHRGVCFQTPTGGGKTIILAHICAGVIARGRRALIQVHRRERAETRAAS